jgi:hypothetical protein
MKYLITFFLLIGVAYGQSWVPMASNYKYRGLKADSILSIPKFADTIAPQKADGYVILIDSTFYIYYKKWRKLEGASFDSTSLSDRINDKIDSIKKIENWVYFKKNGEWFNSFVISSTDTTSLSNRIDSKLGKSDSSIYYSLYRSDTSRLNIYAAINTKLNLSDSAIYQTKYRSDTARTNIYNSIGLKLNITDTANKWVSSVTGLNDSTIRVIKDGTTNDIVIRTTSTETSATRLSTQVYNNSGSTITKGSVVYINGRHSSNLPTIALAKADVEENSYKTFALVETDIATSNSGTAIQMGNIGNLSLPTSTYNDGDLVYLSPTVAGGFTTTKPLAPNHIVKLGSITRAHPIFGSIQINIQNGWQLDELSDIKISAVPNDSTLLQFSRVDSLWHDVSPTTAIGSRYIKPSDTASMLSNYAKTILVNTKLDKSDSATYQTKYRTDTARTNIYSTLNGKLNTSDSSTYFTKYRSDTMRTNVYSGINGKLASTAYDWNLTQAYQAFGSTIKGLNLSLPVPTTANGSTTLVNGQIRLIAYYINQTTTITGVKWYQNIVGAYNQANYNGVGLYSVSGGTLTLVASSTNDSTIFKTGLSNIWTSKAFSSTYSAAPGIYYVALLSGFATVPTLGSQNFANAGLTTVDFTNSNKLTAVLNSQTSFPSSITMSTTANVNTSVALYLY